MEIRLSKMSAYSRVKLCLTFLLAGVASTLCELVFIENINQAMKEYEPVNELEYE